MNFGWFLCHAAALAMVCRPFALLNSVQNSAMYEKIFAIELSDPGLLQTFEDRIFSLYFVWHCIICSHGPPYPSLRSHMDTTRPPGSHLYQLGLLQPVSTSSICSICWTLPLYYSQLSTSNRSVLVRLEVWEGERGTRLDLRVTPK